MNHKEINDLLSRAQSGDQIAVEQFILHYNPIINKYVQLCIDKYELSIVDKDDLIQEARLAIYNNIPNFNFSNVPLIIYRAMTKYIKGNDNAIHMPYNMEDTDIIDSCKVFYLDEDTVKVSYEDCLIDKLDVQSLFTTNNNINLTDQHREVLYLTYYKDYTQGQIADVMELSRQRIAQILNEALKRIRQFYKVEYEYPPVKFRYNKAKSNNEIELENEDFNIFYMDIDLHHEALIYLLENWYKNIFMKCFNFPNEIAFLDNIKEYLAKTEKSKDYEYHVTIMVDNRHTILGGAIYDYFYKSNIGIIEYLAINPNLQNRGYGTKLYKYIREQIENTSSKLYEENHKKDLSLQYQLPYIFCEINDPNKVKDIPQNYLYFWNKLGFQYVNMPYIQPALNDSQKIVGTLKLITNRLCQSYIDINTIKDFLHDYMKYSMNIKNPILNKYYKFMMANISNSLIDLYPIIEEN